METNAATLVLLTQCFNCNFPLLTWSK